MASILGIFDIGRLALFAHQQALSVTSHNIANVSTPGFSRQRPVFDETQPLNSQPGQIGTGVQLAEIRRVVDQFIDAQLLSEQSDLGRLQAEDRVLSLAESVFSDSQGVGLNDLLDGFFSALQDVANNPQSLPERTVLLEQARSLVREFSFINDRFQQLRTDIDGEIRQLLTSANNLTTQIASLNTLISQAETAGQNANDLRDERERLLRQLADLVDINTFEDASGQVTVMVTGGRPLVETSQSFSLQAVGDADNSGFADIAVSLGGVTVDITSGIAGGQLRGLVDVRDTLLPGYINQLDQLSATLVNEVNQQHRAGFALDGSTNNDFFSPLSPTATSRFANTGSAAVSVSVATAASLTFDDYELSFAGGNYTLQNLTTGSSTSGAYVDPTVVTFEGLQVSISGAPAAGDVFSISAHQGVSAAMAVAITDANKVAAASAAANLPGDNANALLLAQLQDQVNSPLGSATFSDFYGTLTGGIGARAQSAQISLAAQEIVHDQLDQRREGTSGVSLDEELTNLLRFQRGFEASARLIRMADELLLTLLGLVR